jgi:hypothetical protein
MKTSPASLKPTKVRGCRLVVKLPSAAKAFLPSPMRKGLPPRAS